MTLFFIGIGEGNEVSDEQGRYGTDQDDEEEGAIAQCVADVATDHAGEHDAEVHDARGKGVVTHLVLARRYLLHHEERQTHETEAIAEVLQRDGASDEPETLRLVEGKERVGDEGQVEDQCQLEEAAPARMLPMTKAAAPKVP